MKNPRQGCYISSRRNSGFDSTARKGCLILVMYLYIIGAWFTNAFRFINCDFEPSYKNEIVYGIGLFAPTFLVSAWVDIK